MPSLSDRFAKVDKLKKETLQKAKVGGKMAAGKDKTVACIENLATKHNYLSFADAISNDGEQARNLLAWCETNHGSHSKRENKTLVDVDFFRVRGTGFSKELLMSANVSSIQKCGERISMDVLVVFLIPSGSFVDLNELATRFDAGAQVHFSLERTFPSNSDSEAMAELSQSMLLFLEVLDVLAIEKDCDVGTHQDVCVVSAQEKENVLLDLTLPIHLRYHAAASPDDFEEARNVSFSFPLIFSKAHSAIDNKTLGGGTAKNRTDIKSAKIRLFDASSSYRLSTCISEMCSKTLFAHAPVGSLAHNDLVPFLTLVTLFSTFALLLMLILILHR